MRLFSRDGFSLTSYTEVNPPAVSQAPVHHLLWFLSFTSAVLSESVEILIL